METHVEIDGSYGEGGGQILRTALSLSTVTGKSVQITNIRANRSRPGLAPQHLTCVVALSEICDAEVEDAELGSTEVSFRPTVPAKPGNYTFNVADASRGGSAGSVTLILQLLLLPLALSSGPSKLTLKGGTHVPWSPPFDFMTDVYLPLLARMGVNADAKLVSWGFFPAGGGRITVEIEPTQEIAPLNMTERGELKLIYGQAVACKLKSHIAVRMINRARNMLSAVTVPKNINPERVKGQGPGASFFLRAEYDLVTAGFSALGEPRKPSEKVAEEACGEFLEHDENGAPITPQLADQLLLPAALANGRSEIRTSRITPHLLTNAHVIQQFVPAKIEIDGNEGDSGIITVEGPAS